MMDSFSDTGLGLAYVALGVAVLVLAKFARDIATPYKLDEELTLKDNPAVGLSMLGYFLGVIAIFLGATVGPEPDAVPTSAELGLQMLSVLGYSVLGIALMNAGYFVVDKLMLSSFSIRKEVIDDRNPGTGAVVCGTYIATGLVVAGSIYGETSGPWWHGIVSALLFFALGQAALIVFGLLYRAFTKYDLHDEIEKDNFAAGVAFGMSVIAIGIVLLRATGQDPSLLLATAAIDQIAPAETVLAAESVESVVDSAPAFDPETGEVLVSEAQIFRLAVTNFVYYALGGFVVLFLLRWVTDSLLLPGSKIDDEIARDKNVSAAMIEGAVAIGIASVVYFVM